MGHIAFVAHGLWQKPKEGSFLRCLVLLCKALAAQSFHKGEGLGHCLSHFLQKRPVTREPVIFHDGENEFAVGVEFR